MNNMDNYLHILTQNTPRGRLSFDDTNEETFPSNDLSMSVMVPENESAMHVLYEDNLTNPESRLNVSRGEFDTTIIFDLDAGSQIIESMYQDFLSFFQSYAGEQEAFNLLFNYEELCCNNYGAVSKILLKTNCTDVNFVKLSTRLCSLQLERNTWRLLRILFQDRLEADMDEGDILMSTLGKMSDKDIVDNLYKRNSYIRQCQLIVDWLEKNAEEDFQEIFFNRFQYFTDKCMSLEHSLNELITSNFNRNRTGVREMDPDAAFRQESYPLHETDKENENRLFKFMFICIRAGKLDEAQQLAERFGEPWLSAALEGWRLFHDPNYENQVAEGQELCLIEGNKYRDLWKAACWEASQAPAISVHEQALYGSLCGNLKAVLPVCKTWSDYLWAYTRASVDKLIEQEIRNTTQQDRSLEELPVEYWDKIDLEEIFQELAASNSEIVKSDSKDHHYVIQKFIILDDIDGLIKEMYGWLNKGNLDGHILRCMAHIILFLRLVGHSTKEELCVPVLEAYVQELIKARKTDLVAPYTSTLPKEQQIIWYAKFLEGITDNNERQKCLQFAEEAGLEISQITKTVVKNIREKNTGNIEPSTDLSAVI
ncbi:nuclear pore complex protein Nup107 [Caerostris extrusa]|uniref:Nuclear pore complex protein n=1 Tax=Caerostris extrusa TaxID=172846 RepID=A0AAV4SAS5_CAEEX|nr:nuclear pore complex protein Nup107 [Caerostris extrusa]